MPDPMTAIVAFVRLVPEDRRLAFRCCRLLVWAMLGVRLRPLKRLIRAIDERVACPGTHDGSPEDALRVCAAVTRRVWPRPACLVVALAGYELLRERGWRVTFVIGGHRAGADFKAHAWLERDGAVVVGAPTDAYRPIWQWPADPAGELESIGI
jgi:Transglutaminase-like superfamily